MKMAHHRRQPSMEAISAVTDMNEAAWLRLENRESSTAGAGERSHHSSLATALEEAQRENARLRASVAEYKKAVEDLGKRQEAAVPSADCPATFYGQLMNRVESEAFLQKLEEVKQNQVESEYGALATYEDGELVNLGVDDPSWWVWVANDLFGSRIGEDVLEGDYVLVSEDEIVDGIATFMARYVASIPRAKTMTPKELQDAIACVFRNMEQKGHLGRLWQMGKFLYSAASWGTTAIGLFKHPMVIRAFLLAVSTSFKLFFRVLM